MRPMVAQPQTPAAPHAEAMRSWMAPNAKKLDLLYVSDYQTDDVYAYSYPQGKLRGLLAGVLDNFVLPAGLCADNAGDVFIPDSADSTILEYAHGSTELLKTWVDPYELPYTCAIDPKTGNLAVVNFESASGGGSVSLYTHGRVWPKEYSYGFLYKYYFGAYADKGKLFVDASYDVPSEAFAFVQLPKGGKSLKGVMLHQKFRIPGDVGWDGKYVVVADSRPSVIYRFAISKGVGTKAGSTRLSGDRSLTEFVFPGDGMIVGADFQRASIAFWKYPAGGTPTKVIGGFGEPFGVTFSKAQR